MNLNDIESELKRIKKEQVPITQYPLFYKGKTRSFNVYEVSPNLLRFNYLNGRIGTEAIEYSQTHGTGLAELDVEVINKIISDWIWNQTVRANKKTLDDIRKKEQIVPGVITRDGIVVDGNRRFMVTRMLNEEGLNRQFKAIILDDTYVDGGDKELEIKRLETEIQQGQDEKVTYGAIKDYIKVMDFVDNYIEITTPLMTYEELSKIMGFDSEKKVRASYRIGKMMVEYMDHIDFPNMWSRLEKTEDLFINLEKNYKLFSEQKGAAGWAFNSDDVEDYKTYGFDIIRWNYNAPPDLKGDWGSKKIRDIYFKNSASKTIFSNEKIWKEYQNNISPIEDIETADITLYNEDNGLGASEKAKKIDRKWAKEASQYFKSALGVASSKIKDKLNNDQPEKFLRDALDKLENLIDEDLFLTNGTVVLNDDMVKLLQEHDRRDTNYKYSDNIRKISEALKKVLKS